MTVGVLGAGAWGTALAVAAARAGNRVLLWGQDPTAMEAAEVRRENVARLPGVRLPATVEATAHDAALERIDLALVAVPAQVLRATLTRLGRRLPTGVPIVICAKGIERGSGLLMSEVVRQTVPEASILALSGPSFASDVGRGLPTAVTIAADTLAQAAAAAERLATASFRLYHSADLLGVEIGGAAKNVLAIACGVVSGRGLGASAVAALTARAFAELMRFGRASGARPETLMGLSGFGDLVLTCGSTQSRNFALGCAIGRDGRMNETRHALVEGVATAPVLLARARALGVDMPIVEAADGILSGRIDVEGAIEALLARPFRPEQEPDRGPGWPNGS